VQYMISLLEGIITFISPCLLPMIPIYITYLVGTGSSKGKAITASLGFVLGFTVVFVALGALAGTIGGFFLEYQSIVNIIAGAIIIFFGLNFLGVFKINIFKGMLKTKVTEKKGFFPSVAFGIVFSFGWTPCVGAFLGSALLLASQQGHVFEGIIMLLLYSLGLGIPFILSAALIENLKTAFDFIKKHYKIINIISASLLIALGVLMATGVLNMFMASMSF